MYRKIIVGFDGSERAHDALALGKLLADTSGAELVVAGVFQFDPVWGGPDQHFQDAEAEYVKVIEEAAASVGAMPEAIPSSSVGRGLHELAEEIGADLVVVGSSHNGRVGQVLAGNVGLSLLHGAPSSVAVAPHGFADGPPSRVEEVVIGYDGSDEARLALDDAIDLARASDALLKIVTVAEPPAIAFGRGGADGWHALKEGIEAMMREHLETAEAAAPKDVRVESVLATDSPAKVLAEIANADHALLVLGSRGYGPLRRALAGTVGSELAGSAPCPVIVHPRPAKASKPAAEPVEADSAV